MTRQALSQYDTRWGRWALLAFTVVPCPGATDEAAESGHSANPSANSAQHRRHMSYGLKARRVMDISVGGFHPFKRGRG